MNNRFFGLNLDFLGFSASLICAIHCALLPLILSLGALSGLSWLGSHAFDIVFIIISVIIASWSLFSSYLNHHRKTNALWVVLLGFMVIIASRMVGHEASHILMGAGGFIIALAHYVNWRMLTNCNACNVAPAD